MCDILVITSLPKSVRLRSKRRCVFGVKGETARTRARGEKENLASSPLHA